MAAVPVSNTAIPKGYFGATVPRVMGVLLGTGVSSFPETARSVTDLTALEIATGGGYTNTGGYWGATKGVQFPDLTTFVDVATGRTEIAYTSSILVSTNSFTATFRWLVICSENRVVTGVDFGTAQTVTSGPLALTVPASQVIAGSYPVQVFQKVG